MSSNITWHSHKIFKSDRQSMNQHKSCILWFTGLSGSGKSTLASVLEEKLFSLGCHTYLLDGDNIRHGLCKDLGFSEADRVENIRRISEVASLFVDAGMIVLTAFISPFRTDRDNARKRVESEEFIEIFVKCPLDICEERDVKGLYSKARQGEIKNFTGIDSPYEEPVNPELTIETGEKDVERCVDEIIQYLKLRGVLS